MKKLTQKVSIVALCLVMLVLSAVPAFAADVIYVENHDHIDCANYYIDGASYKFLIKIPKGSPLSSVTIKNTNFGGLTNMAEAEDVKYQYSDSISDYYMYTFTLHPSIPKDMWYSYGIKLYYDYNGNHYMATNTSYGSTTEGSGYKLTK